MLDLATEACARAIDDAGLSTDEVDGVASFRFLEDSVPSQAVATALGMPGSNWLLDLNLGGQAPCYLVTQAAMAVHLGLARHVVVYRALNGRSGARLGTNRAPGPSTDFRYPVGLTAYVHYISLWARRFLIETGQTETDLASVAVAAARLRRAERSCVSACTAQHRGAFRGAVRRGAVPCARLHDRSRRRVCDGRDHARRRRVTSRIRRP